MFRWTALALMAVLSAFAHIGRPALAVAAFSVLVAWNVVVTSLRAADIRAVRWLDLALSAALLATAPFVVRPTSLATFPFLAAAYPLATVLSWAAETGVRGGLMSAAVLSVPLVLSRPLNHLSYRHLSAGEIISVATGCVYYALGAVIVGLFADSIDRAEAEVRAANERTLVARERSARLEERESLARALHDSILQTLAFLQRRLADIGTGAGSIRDEVDDVRRVIEREERDLRGLLRRGVEEAPDGFVPLRTVLEAAAFGVTDLPVEITTVEPVWLPADDTADVSAAVRQGVENAVAHARASRVTLFGAGDDGQILITVLDDGVGFRFDESRLSAEGRLGISTSMRGRIERLGGTMRIVTSPGKGTKVEFRLPVAQ